MHAQSLLRRAPTHSGMAIQISNDPFSDFSSKFSYILIVSLQLQSGLGVGEFPADPRALVIALVGPRQYFAP